MVPLGCKGVELVWLVVTKALIWLPPNSRINVRYPAVEINSLPTRGLYLTLLPQAGARAPPGGRGGAVGHGARAALLPVRDAPGRGPGVPGGDLPGGQAAAALLNAQAPPAPPPGRHGAQGAREGVLHAAYCKYIDRAPAGYAKQSLEAYCISHSVMGEAADPAAHLGMVLCKVAQKAVLICSDVLNLAILTWGPGILWGALSKA